MLLAGACLLAALPMCAQMSNSVELAPFMVAKVHDRVPTRIDETQVVTLDGNVPAMARPEFEAGILPPETRMEHMLLLLEPDASRQAALDALTAAQQDPRSPLFHQWLTPQQYMAHYGVSPNDLALIVRWLSGHGFKVDEAATTRRLVMFSGDAGQLEDTFHVQMHRYAMDGAVHISNSENPQIPAALSGLVEGIVSLHDLRRVSQIHRATALSARPQWNLSESHYLFPADFAAIYNANPVYGFGITGTGVSIAIAGRSNISLSDVSAFRTAAGLSGGSAKVLVNGADPGLVAHDQDESTLDVEWAGAVAPDSDVTLVASASSAATDGVDLSAAYIVNHSVAPVMSVSYASCEQAMGATELAFYNTLWQQAASEGISVLVASGDSGAAGCDLATAQTGTETAVNGLCSSPYATCVGGTEFNEGSGKYWSAANGATNESAQGYIPEIVWNESASNGGGELWASGGGASRIYSQPAWQQVVSGTGDANGMRAVPDVSLTAASHDGYAIFENGTYWIVSGTSAATPSFAGMLALVVDAHGGSSQGNVNQALYESVNEGANPFHATLAGNNDVPGVAGFTAIGTSYNLATGLGSIDADALVRGWGGTNTNPHSPIPVRGAPLRPAGIPRISR
jgi:subtilase family serine protease